MLFLNIAATKSTSRNAAALKKPVEVRAVSGDIYEETGTPRQCDGIKRALNENDKSRFSNMNGISHSPCFVDAGSIFYVIREKEPRRDSECYRLYDKYAYQAIHNCYIYDYSVALIRIYPLCYHTLPHDLSPLPLPLVIGPEQSGQRRIHLF